MGTMAFSEIAISPPLTFNATSQILPQKASPKIPAARDVSPPRSKTLASAKFTKKTKLARKHKTTNKVARSKANSSDGNYHNAPVRDRELSDPADEPSMQKAD